MKTKISVTLGPSCADHSTLCAMLKAGVDSFRINFSQGTLSEHKALLDTLRRATQENPYPVEVIGDLCGPRFRMGRIRENEQPLYTGDEVHILSPCAEGTSKAFGTNYEHLAQDVEEGQLILIDEGHIHLRVTAHEDTRIRCEVLTGGILKSFKGINLPDSTLSAPPLTDQDWEHVWWAVDNNIDYLAQSFVRLPQDVDLLRSELDKAQANTRIVTKIETAQAVQHLEAIIQAGDIILIARGDLGVEMGMAHVPHIQQNIVNICKQYNKPTILATHILHSMKHHPEPTRAEVADVALAAQQGIDTLMLTGETAIGQYPVEVVQTLRSIVCCK